MLIPWTRISSTKYAFLIHKITCATNSKFSVEVLSSSYSMHGDSITTQRATASAGMVYQFTSFGTDQADALDYLTQHPLAMHTLIVKVGQQFCLIIWLTDKTII